MKGEKTMKKAILAALMVLALCSLSYACTSTCVETTDKYLFYARTMEDHVQFNSKVIVVPKGTQYQGQIPDGTYRGMKYKALYGMVGMNTFDFPYITDGINEEGLTGGTLAFPIAQYQPYDEKNIDRTVSNSELLTYILSQYRSVEEARRGLQSVRVCSSVIPNLNIVYPFHYILHDRTGACIVIEYTGGVLNIHDNPLRVMTNAPDFRWMMTNLSNYVNLSPTNVQQTSLGNVKIPMLGNGSGMLGIPGDFTPPSRFVRMALLTNTALPVTGPDEGLSLAMTLIDNVDISKGNIRDNQKGTVDYENTQWSVVTDIVRKRFYFRSYANKNWRYIDVMEALKDAVELKSISIDSPPSYTNVTDRLKKGMDDRTRYSPQKCRQSSDLPGDQNSGK
jgi:choloylglycine hydrolase